MTPATVSDSNQATEVLLEHDVDRVVVDLVGDLAAYRPHAKVVILEGSEPGGFDEMFVRRLFPDVAKKVNLVSAGPKRRVRDLYRVLSEAVATLGIENRFFAIVDRDSDSLRDGDPSSQEYQWDVYHIENYLLDAEAIRMATNTLTGDRTFEDDGHVLSALNRAAAGLVDRLTLERVRAEVNERIIGAISLGAAPDVKDLANSLRPSIEGSIERVRAVGAEYSVEALETRVAQARREFQAALDGDEWLKIVPGRLILKAFVRSHLGGVAYEPFRNLVVDNIAMHEKRPPGMADVLHAIADR